MPPEGFSVKIASQKSDPFLPMATRFSPPWKLLIALFGGILMGLAPAPGNAWFLAWIALVPLWALVTTSPLRASLAYAIAWGIGYHGLALSWITGLHPLTWMGVPWLASVAIVLFCWVFITLWGAALVAAWALGLTLLSRAWTLDFKVWPTSDSRTKKSKIFSPVWFRVLAGTALWCGLEALWSSGVLWWTSLSYTQSPHNLLILHLGRISGPALVTGAIVAVNGLLAEAWLQFISNQAWSKTRNLLILTLALLVSLHLVGFGLYRQPLLDAPETALKVGIVQGNIPTRIKLYNDGLRLAIEHYINGYEALADQGVEAVLTPEGALPWLWIGSPKQNPFYQTILKRGVAAWVGTVGLTQGKITQTLFAISGTGEIVGHYDKIKLVPLGEYIPFESVLGKLISRLSPVEAAMLPGKLDQRFVTPFGQAIAGICYESAFSQLFRTQAATGGQFILTASNNDPYGAAMMAQHHAQDVMRAVETDRWAVRGTNTGFSGVVDPHGRTQWLSGFRTYETHAHTIYRRQTQTLYVRRGDWLTPLLLIATFIAWGVQATRSREEG